MPRYLYIFGYNTPGQIEALDKHGWDGEDSEAVFIEAESEQAALTWGQQISQQFVHRLYGDRGLSWKPGDYAHWIESEPSSQFTPDALRRLPVVPVGEHPVVDRGRFVERVVSDETSDTNTA
jgi:hypothetical protein